MTFKFKTQFNIFLMIFSLSLITGLADGKALLHAPDGRIIHVKEGTAEPDLSAYRSPLEVKVLDRRFYTNEAMYAADEMFDMGQSGFNDMVKAGFPLENKEAFQWITHQEAYWYARYELGYAAVASHNGIHMVNGPYWTLKAQEFSRKNILVRDRGEKNFSNKDIFLGIHLPLIYSRTGLPRVFDDGQPAYLMFRSGDPHFTGPVKVEDNFEDPQSGKEGEWGVPNYWINARSFRWNHDKMDTTIDMGAEGGTMKRRNVWIGYFLKSNHAEQSPSDQTQTYTFLGNDAEEGFRGVMLAYMTANQLLALKSELVADEKGHLGGINPVKYNPKNGLRYFPHLITPTMLLAGDMPERPWFFDIKDPRSLLWDQGALLWGITEYYHQVYKLNEAFTTNPPVDGGILEQNLGLVAKGMANMVVNNLEAMHQKNGLLASEWAPGKGTGDIIWVKDSSMALVGLKQLVGYYQEARGEDQIIAQKALKMITNQADFLIKVQSPEGAFCEGYHISSRACVGEKTQSQSQFFGIRALLVGYFVTGDEKYTEAARRTWNYVNQNFWDEPSGLFRTRLGDETVILTPLDIGAQLGAIREMMFATPVHMIEPMIERYTRWWIQTVDNSGIQQSEDNRVGELSHGVETADFDNDGIPFMGKGDGKYGIAPVLAGKVAVNLGGNKNQAFSSLKGEVHHPERYGGHIQYAYRPKSSSDTLKGIILPIQFDKTGWIERPPLERWDGLSYPMQAALHIHRGSSLTGKELFERNCALCHGYNGEGITGVPLKNDMILPHNIVFQTPKSGRFGKLMPPWVDGNNDGFGGPLTEEEMHRIVEYIQSDEFKENFSNVEEGKIISGFPPKDAYFYISRSYLNGNKVSANEKDILSVIEEYRKKSGTGSVNVKTFEKQDIMIESSSQRVKRN